VLVCWLQTGRWGTFGKPHGTKARVHTDQVIMSIHTNLQNKEHVIEALLQGHVQVPWPPKDPHLKEM
jgi:large subunit ribosomal protein L10e